MEFLPDELDFGSLEELDFAPSDELDVSLTEELDDLASLLEDVTLEEDFASLLLEVVVLEELSLEELMAMMVIPLRTGCASLPIFWIQHFPSMTLSV